jgi:hypothetical protein
LGWLDWGEGTGWVSSLKAALEWQAEGWSSEAQS